MTEWMHVRFQEFCFAFLRGHPISWKGTQVCERRLWWTRPTPCCGIDVAFTLFLLISNCATQQWHIEGRLDLYTQYGEPERRTSQGQLKIKEPQITICPKAFLRRSLFPFSMGCQTTNQRGTNSRLSKAGSLRPIVRLIYRLVLAPREIPFLEYPRHYPCRLYLWNFPAQRDGNPKVAPACGVH